MATSPQILASFVPAYVARRLVDGSPPLLAPERASFEAAAFFADASGFSSLAARLAEQGPGGAEALTRILNAYFGGLVVLVTAHGGEAIKSAGDALLALWHTAKDRGEMLVEAAKRAAACALAVQATLDGYPVGEFRLTQHIGVGAGEVQALLVGGVGETAPCYPLFRRLASGG